MLGKKLLCVITSIIQISTELVHAGLGKIFSTLDFHNWLTKFLKVIVGPSSWD